MALGRRSNLHRTRHVSAHADTKAAIVWFLNQTAWEEAHQAVRHDFRSVAPQHAKVEAIPHHDERGALAQHDPDERSKAKDLKQQQHVARRTQRDAHLQWQQSN